MEYRLRWQRSFHSAFTPADINAGNDWLHSFKSSHETKVRVEYLILHECFEAQLPEVAPPPPDLERLTNHYRKALGKPFYEDAHLIVFKL